MRLAIPPDEKGRQVRLQPLLDIGANLPARIPPVKSAGRSAVLMLDTRCPACEASRPLYRALREATSQIPNARFVVLVDEPIDQARRWLAKDGIVADQFIKLRSRGRAGFLGTPTLMLIDEAGIITDIANQALSPEDGRRFIERMRRPGVGQAVRVGYFMLEVDLTAEPSFTFDPNLQLVDTRDRAEFRREHSASAINIPRDELLARGAAELVRTRPVYIDCRHDEQELCRISAATMQDAKFTDVRILLQ